MIRETDDHLRLYARLGVATAPLRPRDKRPLSPGWQIPSPVSWCGVPTDANVGVLTGAASGGLLVLDFDREDLLWERLGIRPAELAAHTLVVVTRRGFHVYARHDDCRTRVPAPGFSVLGTGNVAVAPPSIHPSGHRYHFLAPPRAIAPLRSFAVPDLLFGRQGGRPALREEPPAPTRQAETLDARTLGQIEAWMATRSPRLRDRYAILRRGPAPEDFDRSAADYALACCLSEGGWREETIARLLCGLPGSKAQERGWRYAWITARRACRR
jgi:hypothetical protein